MWLMKWGLQFSHLLCGHVIFFTWDLKTHLHAAHYSLKSLVDKTVTKAPTRVERPMLLTATTRGERPPHSPVSEHRLSDFISNFPGESAENYLSHSPCRYNPSLSLKKQSWMLNTLNVCWFRKFVTLSLSNFWVVWITLHISLMGVTNLLGVKYNWLSSCKSEHKLLMPSVLTDNSQLTQAVSLWVLFSGISTWLIHHAHFMLLVQVIYC